MYEDECTICHPELAEAKPKPAAESLLCNEHRVPESECGICHPELVSALAPGHGLKIRFASAESAAKAGVQTAAPESGAIGDAVECYAEISFNLNKLAHVAAPVDGIIHGVEVDLGQRVEEGARLATIWSAAIAETKSSYLRAIADAALRQQTLERERRLRAEHVSSEKDLQEAVAAHRAAVAVVQQVRQQLTTLGFVEEQIEAVATEARGTSVLEIRAPFAGEIVERNAVRGALVESGKALFTLADRSAMWAMLNIPESELAHVRLGQQVELSVEALHEQTFTGTLTWLSPQLDERTRMAQARAEVANADGALKARMFARARILTGHSEGALVIPTSAVQQLDGKPFAFVKIEEDLYEARALRIGAQHNGRLEILAGLRPEDRIVVAHSFVLKSELLKSRLGAGCVDE
ncbi:MAG: efflux RND transporter periplasmic adaptor subunit [Deltaproteobacteria bacterium]|nr:efflux RND transporter periplasmic adaptor subunit [Deltaproteobacteria bacterium]